MQHADFMDAAGIRKYNSTRQVSVALFFWLSLYAGGVQQERLQSVKSKSKKEFCCQIVSLSFLLGNRLLLQHPLHHSLVIGSFIFLFGTHQKFIVSMPGELCRSAGLQVCRSAGLQVYSSTFSDFHLLLTTACHSSYILT